MVDFPEFSGDGAKFLKEFEAFQRKLQGNKEYEHSKKLNEAIRVANKDSDRSAGIVFASIVEYRVTECLRAHFQLPDKTMEKQANDLLSPIGALGAFDTKLDLAVLLGVYGPEAWRTLTTIVKIRNRLAHRMEVDSFDHEQIADLVRNLTYLDPLISTSPAEPEMLTLTWGNPRNEVKTGVGFRKCDNPFDKLHGRYVQTCMFFENTLRNYHPTYRHPDLRR